MKRTLCLFLALILAVGICFSAPVTITASAAEAVTSGNCGATGNEENVTWSLVDGTLTISGTGAMADYDNYDDMPWHNNKSAIKKVVIENGVTTIGEFAFDYCGFLTSVTIPESVTSIGASAFANCSKLNSVEIPEGVITIGEKAFYSCSYLSYVKIPESVTSIGTGAFVISPIAKVKVPCKWDEEPLYKFSSEYNQITVTIADHAYNYGVCEACGYECPGHTYELAICTNCSYVCHHETVTDRVCEVCGGTYCGKTENDTVVYFYNESTKTLTISGEGEMADFTRTTMPWYSYRSEIATIDINKGVTSIGAYSFSYCSTLTSVTIPESVTSIGFGAFVYCTALPSVTIPESVTTISDYAFHGCESLTTEIPDNVTTIGGSAFYDCTSLTTIEIPDSVTTIGSGAFCGCTSLTTIEIPDSVTTIDSSVFSGCTALTTIEIPDSVTTINYGAFNGCTSLTTIEIPDNVTTIDGRAFKGCTSLTTIEIPDNVTTIGDSAFNGCTSLTTIEIPDNVTTIGSNAFNGCTSLTTIEIPDSVTTIGANAFNNCTSLTTVSAPCSWNEKPLYTFGDGVAVNIERHTLENNTCTVCEGSKCGATESDTVTWVYDEGTLYINGTGGMTTTAPWKNYRSEITTVVINNGVTTIGNNAFYGCTSLASVIIPDSVTTIGDDAFNGCTSLTTIEIPDNVTTIGSSAFYDCTSLITIEIPNSVTTIADNAFRNCASLTTIKIPDSVTTIGIYAFEGCTSLASVTIPSSVTSIGGLAFYDCTKLTTVNVPCNWDGSIYKFAESILKFADHDTTKTATCISKAECSVCGEYGDFAPHTYENGKGKCTVANCDNACAHETITDGVCVACGGKHCGNTENDKVVWFCDAPDDAPGDENDETLSILTITGTGDLAGYTIGEAPWEAYRESIRGIDIKDGVTSIGNGTFCGCVSLTSVIIPGSVKIIGVNAFSGCEKLSNVRISEGVTSIGDGVFKGCTALEEITIPESVETIGENAFNSCTMLMTITIPQSVTEIGEGAFGNCTRLTEINVDEGNTTYSSEDGVLFNEEKTELICYPAGKVGDYEVPSGVTKIADFAFSSHEESFTVTIPVSVTTISASAFDVSQYVNLIVEPGSKAHEFATTNSIPYIFNGYNEAETDQIEKLLFTLNADSESYSVTFCDTQISGALKIPATYNGKPVTEIGNYAFANCISLTSVTIPDSVTTIGAGAFNSCFELISITIPESVTAIGSYAFDGCAILASISVDDANTKYSSVDGVLFNKDKTELICYPTGQNAKSYTILDSVITIGEDAFKNCTELTSVTIPDSVTTIGESAFYGCSELTSVKIGNGVTEIDDYAFDGCNNLSTVNVPCNWDTENPLYAFTENVSVVVADHKEIIYVDNNDGTHTAEYPCCGTVIGEPEKHSFDESEYCEFCEYQCPHPNYTNGRCDVCACYCPHTNTEPVYNSYEDNTNQHYKHYECCGVDEWAGYHEDENGDTKCDQCNVQLVAKAYLEPWTSQGVCNGDNYFVSLENAVDKVNEIYCKELILLSDAIIEEEKTITLESAILNTNGNKLTVNGTLVLSDSEYTGTTIPTGVVGSGTVKIGENFFKLADNGKWCCAEESQHTGSVQTCVGYLCELCGNYYGEANDNHDIVIDKAVAPTCTKTGLTEGSHCTRCDDKTVKQNVIPTKAHTEVTVTGKAATCTESGLTDGKKCSVCGVTTVEQKVIAATGHKEVTVTGKAATCTASGLTDGKKCSVCGTVTKAQETIKAKGHTTSVINKKDATCTADGYTGDTYCSTCKTTTVKGTVIKATGHKEVAIPAVAPTYTTVGKTEGKKCSVCGTITVAQKDVAKLTLATPVVTAVANNSGIKVNWNNVENAQSYVLYKRVFDATANKWSKWKIVKTGLTGFEYIDSDVVLGTKYRYTVRAKNGDTLSPYKTTTTVKYNVTPTVKVANDSNGVKVTWTTVANATGYRVYRSTLSNGKWSNWKNMGTAKSNKTSWTDKSVKSNVTYKYTVRAVYNKVLSSYNKAGASVLFLSTPTVKIANNASGIKVSWNKIAGATGYTVYSSTYDAKTKKWSSWKNRGTAKANKTSWVDKNVKSGVKYKYTVRAVNGKTKSTYVSSGDLLYLAQPAVTVKSVSNGINISWTKSSGATEYKIYRSEYNAKTKKWSSWKGIKSAKSTVKSYTDKTTKKGVKYKYTVRAINGKVKSSYKASNSISK